MNLILTIYTDILVFLPYFKNLKINIIAVNPAIFWAYNQDAGYPVIYIFLILFFPPFFPQISIFIFSPAVTPSPEPRYLTFYWSSFNKPFSF